MLAPVTPAEPPPFSFCRLPPPFRRLSAAEAMAPPSILEGKGMAYGTRAAQRGATRGCTTGLFALGLRGRRADRTAEPPAGLRSRPRGSDHEPARAQHVRPSAAPAAQTCIPVLAKSVSMRVWHERV
ncbi:unnamed protein product [Prorocentrum cordatum]|uniref:Uncharacterized protein n=1 Tax=Prorocentrum cordatum TaxID=2364126 RepID=A0ABN9W5A8_9DINO|nr:unnamed protein product [Polarella glacialis]